MIWKMMKRIFASHMISAAAGVLGMLAIPANAAIPGIGDPAPGNGKTLTFNLAARADYTSQPDGQSIYSWG